jgi:hypothetical protein
VPIDEWSELGARRRREVARAARRGAQHPDPSVAAVAQRWAAGVLGDRPQRAPLRERLGGAGAWAFVVVLAAWLDWAPEVGLDSWWKRRLARRVIAAQ